MRAIQIDEFGGPDKLIAKDIPIPTPEENEVVVKLEYSGINYMDVYMRNGSYAKSHTYQTPLPMTVGMEGAGTIHALGKNVTVFKLGERVAYCLSRGSYAEYAAVPAWRLVKIPESVNSSNAAALMLQGLTAHYLTNSAYSLTANDSCLIHAGAGGVGQLAIQLAKLKGATVITTVGSEEKAEIATKLGADHTILYRELDFQKELMRITENQGVNVVYDSVGKDTIDRSIRCLQKRGLCVMFGASSGQVAGIAPLALAEAGSIYFTRPHLADYIPNTEVINQRMGEIFSMISDGKLHASIHDVYPLSEIQKVHELLESRATLGKFLLNVA
ncbi:MAG: quinone oxidoreductase family protein [Polynucleobacter sp.]